jgi:nucleoside-diphosphate-sugar epimerase
MASDPLTCPELRGASCLVTGGLGFIGSNLALALIAGGARVAVVDALVPQHGGDRRNLDGAAGSIPVTIADIGDRGAMAALLDGVEFIFNVAGQVSHLESMTDPLRDLDLNVRSHLALLELVRELRPGAVVVHTSTRQVYGRPRYLPVDEDHPTAPVDVNGVDKLAAEQLHLLYATVHDMAISALRLTNVYGPRQSLVRDGLGFLPVFLRRALRGEPIRVYGDGRQLRDCLYVDDVVRALVLAAVTPDSVGQVFNLGHDDALDLAEIARTVAELAGGASAVSLVPWPDDLVRIDIGSFWGDFSKAKRVLGWEPEIGFGAGIEATIAFYREHPWYLSST